MEILHLFFAGHIFSTTPQEGAYSLEDSRSFALHSPSNRKRRLAASGSASPAYCGTLNHLTSGR